MSKFCCVFAVFACIALSSCALDRLKFWDRTAHKNYAVSGLDDTEETKTYVQSIIENGFAKDLDDGEESEYRQETVRIDVLKAMRAKGYYDADVIYADIDEENGRFDISSGKVVTISSIAIVPSKYNELLGTVQLKAGEPLDAAKVLAAQRGLYQNLQKDSCAFDLDVTHSVLFDPAKNAADVIFEIEQGKEAAFGEISYSGNENVKRDYLDKLISWKEGSCFKHNKLGSVRDKLLGTGLFSKVDAVLPDDADKAGIVPVEFALKERAPRTVRAGVSYYTDEGAGVVLGWEHRNFFGSGEKLKAALTLSLLEQSLEAKLTKPYFLRNDQTLSLRSFIEREDNDAFESLALGGGFGVKRKLGKHLSGRVGADIELTRVMEENADTDNFALLSPVASLSYDSRNDTLDPHKGLLARVSVEPSIDVLGESDPFVKNKFTVQTYHEVNKKLVLAARLNIGSIIGSSADNLPASERFYAGGGGSVRGFGFQEVGPFEKGDPVGGRSLIVSSFELRFKATEKLGGVAFIDVGQVDNKVTPAVDDLSVGAGLGFRYYTDFGPLRFDIGLPLRGDENTDANFQVYMSIGQAF